MNCKQVSFLGLLWFYFVVLLSFLILYTKKELSENNYYNEADEQINNGTVIVVANIANTMSLFGFIIFWTLKFNNNSLRSQAIVCLAVIIHICAFITSWMSFLFSNANYDHLVITPLFILISIYIALSSIFIFPCLVLILLQPFRYCFVVCDDISIMISGKIYYCFAYIISTISDEDTNQQYDNTNINSIIVTERGSEVSEIRIQ
jgi:hypothetical protein